MSPNIIARACLLKKTDVYVTDLVIIVPAPSSKTLYANLLNAMEWRLQFSEMLCDSVCVFKLFLIF